MYLQQAAAARIIQYVITLLYAFDDVVICNFAYSEVAGQDSTLADKLLEVCLLACGCVSE